MKLNLLAVFCFFISTHLFAQTVLTGVVSDSKTNEKLIGVFVNVKGTNNAVTTDYEGQFLLKTNQNLPLVLLIKYIGYQEKEISIESVKTPSQIKLQKSEKVLKEVVVKDSRISERQRQNPLTVETMDALAIKQTPAANFYEGLAHLKGVDLTSASIGFKIINTRGFNSTSPVRSLQLIDGVDNQSPGLNFSLGNFLGASELDVQKVDLVVGASSAYYGPNAFNGVISMSTKNPFVHPGLSAQIKVGERNLMETSIRWAQVFKNKKGEDVMAYKLNIFYMKAYDWNATNYNPTAQSPVFGNNPGMYDAVNKYGDEYSNPIFRSQLSNLTYVGQGYFLRDGYKEKDLVDYNSKNLKVSGALHYKISEKDEFIYTSSFASGTTIYQGDNRFSLKDIMFFQNKFELKREGKYFIRLYATNEDAGKSYDAYATALILQNSVKKDFDWGKEYSGYLTGTIGSYINSTWYPQNYGAGLRLDTIPGDRRLAFIENYWRTIFADSLVKYHDKARLRANSETTNGLSRLIPGTAQFDSAFAYVTSRTNREGGSRFFDQSALYHLASEYQFTRRNYDFKVGGNFRLYAPFSKGTIFLDTAVNQRIYNREVGIYVGVEKKFLENKLKLSMTIRGDKNENFNSKSISFDETKTTVSQRQLDPTIWLWSPAISAVYSKNEHVFRVSISSALRNPTLTDQYINLNVGRATLLGNLNGFDSLVTIESLISAFNAGNKTSLNYFSVAAVKPEQVKTIDLGYRVAIKEKLFADISYYYSWYQNFLGYKIGAVVDWPGVIVNDVKVYRVTANSADLVTTQGFSFGINYFYKKYLGFVANYSWNKLDRQGSLDPLIPAFNTPEHKYNFGINGRDIALGNSPFWGYSINWKWQQGFMYEGSPQFTGEVPSYSMLDAQVNKKFSDANCTVKIGANNLLDNLVFQVCGGPFVGRLAYISVVFEFDKWK